MYKNENMVALSSVTNYRTLACIGVSHACLSTFARKKSIFRISRMLSLATILKKWRGCTQGVTLYFIFSASPKQLTRFSPNFAQTLICFQRWSKKTQRNKHRNNTRNLLPSSMTSQHNWTRKWSVDGSRNNILKIVRYPTQS